MSRRFALPILVLALSLAAWPAAADALLRPRVIVEGATVTLGDLFDNVGDKAGRTVMRAPAPGQRVTVDSDFLQHVAVINGVTWHPRGLFEEAVIERSCVAISHEQIVASLQDALAQHGAPADFQIDTDNRTQTILVTVGTLPRLVVRDLYYDRQSQRFTANLSVPQDSGEAARVTVSGRLTPTLQIPVLNRTLARGETIAAADIAYVKLPEADLRAAIVKDPGQMVGMNARQMLRAGQPLSLNDLQKPLAVASGALVTMTLSHGAMTLTAQGRALDQGSLGDVIRVTNTHSNQTIEATIIGPNQVRVSLNSAVALVN
jgi:flagella basal body P-ring formation protein FlgA